MGKSVGMTDTTQLRINGERLRADFETLAAIGRTPEGGVSRPALSLEDLEGRLWFANRIEECGFTVVDDDAGNLSGIWHSPNPTARTLLLGSHLDTVPDSGCYDGSIGVLAGLEVMRTLYEAGQQLPFHLETIDFTDEEGTWLSLLGSRGLTGRLPLNRLNDARGEEAAMRAALKRAGIDLKLIQHAKRDPSTVAGFLELHIEQGNVLESLNAQIGIVGGIVGRTTHQLTFHGERGHSGTTSLYNRKDALQGAAMFVTQAHNLAHDRFDGTIVNCGQLQVFPGTFNVIPERAQLLFECRHVDEEKLLAVEAELLEIAAECASAYRLEYETHRVEHIDAAPMHTDMMFVLERVCRQLELRHTSLVSYAGHDAQPLSHFTPTGMIFVPSVNGISHSPNEFTEWDDVVNGANVLLQAVLALTAQYPPHPPATPPSGTSSGT